MEWKYGVSFNVVTRLLHNIPRMMNGGQTQFEITRYHKHGHCCTEPNCTYLQTKDSDYSYRIKNLISGQEVKIDDIPYLIHRAKKHKKIPEAEWNQIIKVLTYRG